MINTAAFESLERYNRIDAAIRHILSENGLHPYEWMRSYLVEALAREKGFMINRKQDWVKFLSDRAE